MLNGLNDEQIDAVKKMGNVLLTACPGSGKTRTLTRKIAYELSMLTQSKKVIIAVTFTNRAADEIKKRIQVFNINDSNLWAGTIHAFCLEWIIRPYSCYLVELQNGFSIADEYFTEELIKELKGKYELGFFTSVTTRYKLSGEVEEEEHPDLIAEYHSCLQRYKLIDFDQILFYSYKLLNDYPLISKILKKMFHYVCIDEYQDTQQLQYAIFSKIMKVEEGTCRMFIVGDADQAIYGSLGGVAKTHEEIEYEFNAKFSKLELHGNYRSNQQIIDYYKNFQTTNLDIQAFGDNATEQAVITYNKTINKDHLDQYIANIINKRICEGIPESEICVLAPTWQMIIPMGRKLKTLLPKVNFDAVGLSPLLKSRENIWFLVARLFLVPPSPKMIVIRKRWSSELVNELSKLGVSIFEESEFPAKKLLKLINNIVSDKVNGLEYLEECFAKFCSELNINKDTNEYLNQHWQTFFEGARNRLANPDFELLQDIESFRRMFKQNQGVVVNTCHGIKGEEFDTVIAFGLLEGKLPFWGDCTPGIADKLLYVIGSRAKKELHLISERGRTTNKGKIYVPTNKLNRVDYSYD